VFGIGEARTRWRAREVAQHRATVLRTWASARHLVIHRGRLARLLLPTWLADAHFLSYYATQFKTVEIDSSYYGTTSASTVMNWYERTPADFFFATRVPQVVTHENLLVNCEAQFYEFVDPMHLLGEKLGSLLLQFPWCIKYQIQADELFRHLHLFLKRVKDLPTMRLENLRQGVAG
jgi:uncharacterized protein YecE (DUF72 family)